MKRLIPALAALLLAAGAAYAQSGPSGAAPTPPGARARSCDQAPDPARCEARRKERREAFEAARQACKDTAPGPERRACMTKQLCARAKDPAQCEQRAAQRASRRRAAPSQQ
ncbi:MAG TPA: hypothetical protein VLX30_16050 [Burkholderiales bacterium]|nr:hypothetical protein [Burkholderiales bacterium]